MKAIEVEYIMNTVLINGKRESLLFEIDNKELSVKHIKNFGEGRKYIDELHSE